MRGTTITLEAEFTNWNTGTNIDVDSVVCKIYYNGALIKEVTSPSIAHIATGKYQYHWTVPESQSPGLYVYVFEGKYSGRTVKNDAILRIRKRKRAS